MKFAVSSDFPEEKHHGGKTHPEDGDCSQLDLLSYLMLLVKQMHKVGV